MKRKQFNKKIRRRRKINLARKASQKKLFSKRMGGIVDNSVIIENRDVKASDLSTMTKETV